MISKLFLLAAFANPLSFQGSGQALFSTDRAWGPPDQNRLPCQVSLQAAVSPTRLVLSSMNYDCSGGSQWQDENIALQIHNGRLRDSSGHDRGRVLSGGGFEITESSTETETDARLILDEHCKVREALPVNFTLQTTLVYELSGVSKTGIGFARHFSTQTVGYRRSALGCPAVLEPVVLGNAVDVQAQLLKKYSN